MPQFRYTITKTKFDGPKFTKTLDKHVTSSLKEATKEFLRAVILDFPGGFPVYSGMMLGTLVPLARELKIKGEVIGTITPDPAAKYKSPHKTPELGEQFGKDYYIKTDGKGYGQFFFNNTLFYYNINEYMNVNRLRDDEGKQYFHLKQPGPYLSFRRGQKAFTAYLHGPALKKAPKISQFIGLGSSGVSNG